MNFMKKYITEITKIGILLIVVLLSVKTVYGYGPTSKPPGKNVVSPITASVSTEEKKGILGTRGFYSLGTASFSLVPRDGWPSPISIPALVVNGNMGATVYCNEIGKLCKTFPKDNAKGPTGDEGQGILPKGSVVAFNLTSCPATWTRVGEGYSIVGMDSSGSNLGQEVGVALTDGEYRPIGGHTHSLKNNYHPGAQINSSPGSQNYYSVTTAGSGILVGDGKSNSGPVVGATQDDTTFPYVQLLYCQKK